MSFPSTFLLLEGEEILRHQLFPIWGKKKYGKSPEENVYLFNMAKVLEQEVLSVEHAL